MFTLFLLMKKISAFSFLSTHTCKLSFSTEANYHCIIQRNPIREKTDAWQRVLAAGDNADVPPELEEWVKAAVAFAAIEEDGAAEPFFATATADAEA